MLGLCRYLQMNCTANSSISNSLFGLNKRRFILFFAFRKRKILVFWYVLFKIYWSVQVWCSNNPIFYLQLVTAVSSTALRAGFCTPHVQCWDARIGFCHYWQKGLRKHSGSGCASQDAAFFPPKHPSTCTGHVCVCVRVALVDLRAGKPRCARVDKGSWKWSCNLCVKCPWN